MPSPRSHRIDTPRPGKLERPGVSVRGGSRLPLSARFGAVVLGNTEGGEGNGSHGLGCVETVIDRFLS
jgi:hypothetical protein